MVAHIQHPETSHSIDSRSAAGGSRTSPEVGHLALAGLLTLAVFLVVPALDLLSPAHRVAIEFHAVTRLDPPSLPPPQTPPPAPVKSALPKPRLSQPRPMMPLRAVLDLDPPRRMPEEIMGDFAMDFGVPATDLLAEVEEYIFELADVDSPPLPIVRMEPVYPPAARMQRIDGEVHVDLVVDADGSVRDAEVVFSNPEKVFDEAALRAVRRWRFKPGEHAGQPVPVRVRQRLQFSWEDP